METLRKEREKGEGKRKARKRKERKQTTHTAIKSKKEQPFKNIPDVSGKTNVLMPEFYITEPETPIFLLPL